MTKISKIIILTCFLFVLFIPMMQQGFKPFKNEYTLNGAYTEAKDTALTGSTWFNRDYQKKEESFLNENFGFREFFVRLNNEIDYSFYGDVNLLDIFKGKNGYLFNSSFFNTYSGRDYKGDKYADSLFTYIQKLNNFMKAKDKKLLVCFAPCKESFYSEYLPDSCKPFIKQRNYYNYYKSRLLSDKIPVLDFNTYFLNIKSRSPYPLFVKGAVHWTTYGAYLALDSLLKRVSFEVNKKTLLIKLTSFTLSDSARETDDDIIKAMNLLSKVKGETLAYPKIEYINEGDSTCYKPKVIIVGDSFYMNLNNTWIPANVFSKESYFLYYFLITLPNTSEKKSTPIEEFNLEAELENTDLLILFFNVGRLDDFHFESTHKLFYKNKS